MEEDKELFDLLINDSEESDFEDNVEGGTIDKIIPIFAEEEEEDPGKYYWEIDGELPILTLRNMVLFPTSILPVTIGRESTLRLLQDAHKSKCHIGVFCQIKPETDEPMYNDLYHIGAIATVERLFPMPDGNYAAILQGKQRIELEYLTQSRPYLIGAVKDCIEKESEETAEFKAVIEQCRRKGALILNSIKKMPNLPDVEVAMKNIEKPSFLINFIASNMRADVADKYSILVGESTLDCAYALLNVLNKEVEHYKLRRKIHKRTNQELEQQQKEYFLQQQIKVIQEELGGSVQDQDTKALRKKADEKNWNSEIEELFGKELAKLERINPQTPDYHVQLNYLQLFVSLPWGKCTTDNLDIARARKVLDRDHYGLDKVKERILEHLAVIKMRGDLKSPIICLYGPPGVGKTSLGKSIAEALERKYVRMSLGGVHDESEIRGHRKTYIGAMPGRILKNLAKAGSDNPVFILDEIDKVGQASNHGDPSSALLEVLDPEQNNTFHDNFLDADYDLSNVMFIATANNLSSIPGPLLDRMELIEVSGYLTEEKIEIAKRHLVPKEKEANGVSKEKVAINKAAIERIIEDYTRESGVRGLEKKIGKIFRRLACQKATNGEIEISTVKPANLPELLGPKEFSRDIYQGNDYAGVVVGLAWTAVGGEILFIETSLSRGKGDKLTLTGNLGDVMKESAMLALEYIKAHSTDLDIPYEVFDNWHIHLHVPEGAIPKDGPSAGITMATALASALTQRKVRPNLAMTGEITLRGKVLPVGGIKEKILAAKRAGIKEIILCKENERNINAIPEMYIKGLTFHYVEDVKDVLEIALMKERVTNPVKLV